MIRIERRFDNSIERVFRAVTEPDEMEQWFVVRPNWRPKLGETFEAYGYRGEITEYDPPHAFAWVWGVEEYRFELESDGDGCRLVFTHVFNPELGPQEQHERGWRAYFSRLEAHLAGGHLSEDDAHAALRD